MARLDFKQNLIIEIYWDRVTIVRHVSQDILDACLEAEKELDHNDQIKKIVIWREVTPEIAVKEFEFKRDEDED